MQREWAVIEKQLNHGTGAIQLIIIVCIYLKLEKNNHVPIPTTVQPSLEIAPVSGIEWRRGNEKNKVSATDRSTDIAAAAVAIPLQEFARNTNSTPQLQCRHSK